MTNLLIGILSTAVLTGIGWLLRMMIVSNSEKHQLHFAHYAPESNMHQTQEERKALAQVVEAKIDAHEKLDQERFQRIESALEEMKADIKLLLKRRK